MFYVGFCKIITSHPVHFLPKDVAAFYLSWQGERGGDEATIRVSKGNTVSNTPYNVINLINAAYKVKDEGLELGEITAEQLQEAVEIVMIVPIHYTNRMFVRSLLAPEFRIVFEFVQRIFLNHNGSYD